MLATARPHKRSRVPTDAHESRREGSIGDIDMSDLAGHSVAYFGVEQKGSEPIRSSLLGTLRARLIVAQTLDDCRDCLCGSVHDQPHMIYGSVDDSTGGGTENGLTGGIGRFGRTNGDDTE